MESKQIADKPIMVVLDPEGYIVRAGEPAVANKKETFNYLQSGHTIKTIPFSEYQTLKWTWDKPAQSPELLTPAK